MTSHLLDRGPATAGVFAAPWRIALRKSLFALPWAPLPAGPGLPSPATQRFVAGAAPPVLGWRAAVLGEVGGVRGRRRRWLRRWGR